MMFLSTLTLRQRKIGAVIAGIFLIFGLLGFMVQWQLSPPDSHLENVAEFTVEPGQGLIVIAQNLKSAGFIRSSQVFVFYANIRGVTRDLKAGTYLLSPAMSVPYITKLIVQGKGLSSDIEVTIPEGMNAWEIDWLLADKKLIVPGSFARIYQAEEGKLFPETYRFAKSIADHAGEYANARTIGDILLEEFDSRARSYSREELVIASILEKEAKSAEDMALVAGIIAKRRELGMPLQIDATVAYGWCLQRWLPMSSNLNCDVTQAPIATEIKVKGDYNTYTQIGLPKGPISNPGLKALKAAANPESSPYLYYLSTRDGSQLIYSKTLSEHLVNRREYLGF